MRRFALHGFVLALAISLLPAAPAIAAPALTGVTLSVESAGSGIPITINGVFSQPTPWRVDVLAACGGPSRRTLVGYTAGGAWQVQWDGLDEGSLPLAPGLYRFRIAPTDANGAPSATPVEKGFEIAGTAAAFCPNVQRFGTVSVFDAGLAEAQDSTAPSIIVTTADDLGYAAIASSYARRVKAPLVLIPRGQSTTSLVSLLAKRKLKAVLIGPPAAVPTALEAALKLKRVAVVRLSGADRAATAAVVAARLKPTPGTTAVYAPLGGSPITVAIASGYANALGVPLLAAGTTLPKSTVDAFTTLQLKGGVAIGDSAVLSETVLKALPQVSRIIGKDLASTSFALVRSIPAREPTLVLESATQPDPLQLVLRAQRGEPHLLLPTGELSTALKSWLSARADLQQSVVTARVGRSVAINVGRLITDRGEVGALPLVQARPFPALTVPRSFTFSGSGFGHGVGMSQWGAYGQAKEGRSATEILQHYFSGSAVAPITDSMDINVSLDSRVQSGSFRLERLSDANSKLEVTAGDGTVTLVSIGDVVKTTYNGGRIDVAITGSTSANFTTNSLTLRWPGNRESGTATGGPAVLRYAGPGASISSGARYRYGYMLITPARVSGALALGLQINNVLRLHDEYLYGIAEVSSSWPSATLQAQVITARSFAFRKIRSGIRSACACHIYDDPRDQNFTGYAKLAERNVGALWKAAVDATAVSPTQGLALTVGGNVVSAYYSAASGGMTQNNEDVWGGSPLSYTRSVDDRWSLSWASSSVTRWVPRSFSQATMAAAFGAPDVVTIDLSDRYPSGAVNRAVAISSSGQRFVVGAETLKSRLNRGLQDAEVLSRGIPSVWMWRVEEDVDATSATTAALDLATSSALRNLGRAQATSSTVVIVQADAPVATLALASAYAGVRGFGLLVNPGPELAPTLRSELTRRKAARVIFVGSTTAQTATTALKIPTSSVSAPTAAALSAALAVELGVATGTPAVITASSDEAALPLAVNLSTRLRRPLLFVDAGVIAAEVSAVLAQQQPESSIVIGAADRVPDAAVAGIGTVERLTVGDPKLAAVLGLTQRIDTQTVGVIAMQPLLPTAVAVVVAGLALPLVYLDDAPPEELLELLRRAPALTLVVRAGVTPESIALIRRS